MNQIRNRIICFRLILLIVLNILTHEYAAKSSVTNHSLYQDFVIEIDETVSSINCSDFLKNLETTLHQTARRLYTVLDGLIYFRNFSVILPSNWSEGCIPKNRTLSRSRGETSDMTISSSHRLFGDQIWTQQSGRCGERGDQIFASSNSFKSERTSKELLKEWIKYRFGVFDEVGYNADEIYPLCYTTDKQYVTGCLNARVDENDYCDSNRSTSYFINTTASSSLMYLPQPQQDNKDRICDEHIHDRLAPTKQNLLCDRQSIREVILKNTDFSYLNLAGILSKDISQMPNPNIGYLMRKLTRFVIVIDETQNIFVRESWSFLRSAIRKWLVYDLQPNTEVGIVLADETSVDKILDLTELNVSKNRDLIASFIPYIPSDSPQSACLACGIREALKLLSNRRKIEGSASEVILVIAPGVDYQVDLKHIVDWAVGNLTRIVTINFPNFLRRRPLDELAESTGGDAFTVLERKYNSEKSFLNTYFDLTTILSHISSKYFEGSHAQLPVEIHRKELVDKVNDSNSAKRISRVISSNFYLDESMTTPSGFFIYTHNVEVPLIQNVKLTSPGGITYGTRSDLRIPVKQITIIASVNQTGPWSYRIERFNGNPQPHFVQVLASPKSGSASIVRARAWIKKLTPNGPSIVYCEVKCGGYPVHSAYVEARVSRPDLQCNYTNNCMEKLRLLDTGSGDPDITKGDGIYTRYFSAMASGPGIYRFDIIVDDNGNTAHTLPHIQEGQIVESMGLTCCGSVIPDTGTKQIPPFQRHLPPIVIIVNQNETETEQPFAVGRIGDLTGKYIGDGKIRLSWTAPDMGGQMVSKYDVRYALNLLDIINNFDTVATIWSHASPYPYSTGDITNFILDTKYEPSLVGLPLYLAIQPFAKMTHFVTGPVSNPVRVLIPASVKSTTAKALKNLDDSMELNATNQVFGFADLNNAGKRPLADSNAKEYSIAIAVGMFLICTVVVIYLIFCITQRHRRKVKRNSLCNINLPHTTIDPIPCSTNATMETKPATLSNPENDEISEIQKQFHNQQHFNPISNNYQAIEPPDHHIIGLPVCSDQTDYQKKDYLGRFTPTLYSACGTLSVISSNDNSLTRQGRMLSPYESWTASQLLHEHECRVSPTRDLLGQPDPQVMNHKAPPIPPLPADADPYQLYSDTFSEISERQQPPAYSTIRRNGGAQQISQASPRGMNYQNTFSALSPIQDSVQGVPHIGEKKRRNITMV